MELFRKMKEQDPVTNPWYDRLLDDLKDDWDDHGFIRRVVKLLFPFLWGFICTSIFLYFVPVCGCEGRMSPTPWQLALLAGTFIITICLHLITMLFGWLFTGKPFFFICEVKDFIYGESDSSEYHHY